MGSVILAVEPDRADDHRLSFLTDQLFTDLRSLGGFRISRPEAVLPEGAKSGAASSIGELVVSGVLSAGSVSALAGVVVAYIKRTGARAVTVKRGKDEYHFTGLAKQDQRALIERLVADVGDQDSERHG